MNRYKNTRSDNIPRPKRYYKRQTHFPEGIDRLEAEVCLSADGFPIVTKEQIERWVDELFLGGGLKSLVGYIILRYGAWKAAMDAAMSSATDTDLQVCGQSGADFAPMTVQMVRSRHKHREGVKYAPPSPQTTGFRAAWALEWAYEQAEPGDLPEWFFDRIVSDFAASSNGSLHRIYAKIACDRMRFGGVRPTGEQAELMAEKCFDLVIDPRTKTAVKFWCLEILSELAPRLDWVAGELPETLLRISETPDCSPGIIVATREILKRLKVAANSER